MYTISHELRKAITYSQPVVSFWKTKDRVFWEIEVYST